MAHWALSVISNVVVEVIEVLGGSEPDHTCVKLVHLVQELSGPSRAFDDSFPQVHDALVLCSILQVFKLHQELGARFTLTVFNRCSFSVFSENGG